MSAQKFPIPAPHPKHFYAASRLIFAPAAHATLRAMPQDRASRDPVAAYISLGANLGPTRLAIETAIARIAELPGTQLVAQSSLYHSAALGVCRTWGVDSENRLERGQFLPDLQPTTPKSDSLLDSPGPDYINAVVQIMTTQDAYALLRALQTIEQAAGRQRPYRFAPRTLDLDLLRYGSAHIDSETLTLPHPRMYERAFVLLPLHEIAPHQVSAAQLHRVSKQHIQRIR